MAPDVDPQVRLRHPAELPLALLALVLGAIALLGGVGPFKTGLPPELSQLRSPLLVALPLSLVLFAFIHVRYLRRLRGIPARELDTGWIHLFLGLFLVLYLKAAFLDWASFSLNGADLSAFASASARRGLFIHANFLHAIALWSAAIVLDRLARSRGLSVGARLAVVIGYLVSVPAAKALHSGPRIEGFYPLAGFLLLGAIEKLTQKKSATTAAHFVAVWAAVSFLARAADTSVGDAFERLITSGWWPFLLPAAGLLGASPFFLVAAIPFFAVATLTGDVTSTGFGCALLPLFFFGWIDGHERLQGFFPGPGLESRTPQWPQVALAAAFAGTALIGGDHLVLRRADLEAFSAAREIWRRVPEGARVCAPGILLPHAIHPVQSASLDRGCLAKAEHAIVFTRGHDAVRRATRPLSEAEMAEMFRTLEGSGWVPVGRAAGFASYRRR